ncbi:MAG: LacI family transcriptional regulator [Clostridium sp.]|nr:LacI family transcriptional regulator [Clostridium sp.]
MATIKDIAREAGVSPSTVSNVFNGKVGKVSQKTFRQIIDIAERLGYHKLNQKSYEQNAGNAPGRKRGHPVAGAGSRLIAGIALGHRQYNFLENPIHAQFFGEIIHTIQEYGYCLMLLCVERYEQITDVLRQRHADGAIIVGAPDSIVHKLSEQLTLPITFIDSYSDKNGISKIGIDDFGGGALAARHLLSLGHTQIAVVSYWYSYEETGAIRERVLGFESELANSGQRLLKKNLFLVDSEKDRAFERAAEEIAGRSKEISAVFCAGDCLAVSLIGSLAEKGIRVPEDLSVIGFDDSLIAMRLSPGLTTIRQDISQKAQIAAELLLNRIHQAGVASQSAVLPVSLIERDTTTRNTTRSGTAQ